MDKKILIGIGAGILVLLLFFGFFMGGTKITGNSISHKDTELEKYRSAEIPEECRLPDYENDLTWWKEHLGHHQNTLYCLEEYYK